MSFDSYAKWSETEISELTKRVHEKVESVRELIEFAGAETKKVNSLELENTRLKAALEEIIGLRGVCSCHISPPCSNCENISEECVIAQDALAGIAKLERGEK